MVQSIINQRFLSWSQARDLLKSHKNYWRLGLGLLGANLLFYFCLVAGEIDQIDQLQQRYQAKRQGLAEIRKHQSRTANYAERQKAWQIFQESIANKITFPDRLADLEDLFHRHHLNPNGMTFKSEKLPGLQLVRFASTIETTGNYADLKALLNGIRQLPGLFCIEHLSIDKNRKAGTLVMKFHLAAYFNDTSQSNKPSNRERREGPHSHAQL